MTLTLLLAGVLLAGWALSVVGIPPPAPAEPRHGVVLESHIQSAIGGVRVRAVKLDRDCGARSCPLDTTVTTNDRGAYHLPLGGCRASVTFAKPGYRSVTLRWPEDLAPNGSVCQCSELNVVRLERVGGAGYPDLSGAKGEHALFVIGMLDDSHGRRYRDGDDTVERFYCGEHVHAMVYRAYLDSICAEQGIETTIREERIQDCLIRWHSPELAGFVNSFYRYTIAGRQVIVDGGEPTERFLRMSYEQFENMDRELKLAYLAGAWFRYREPDGFRFSDSKEKVTLVARLLEDVGCSNVAAESSPGYSVPNKVSFTATPELLNWFERLPGGAVDDAIDSYTHALDSDELEIYKTVLKAAGTGAFEGCKLGRPLDLYRITFIAMDGNAEIPDLAGARAEALANYNDIRTEFANLRTLDDGTIQWCIRCGEQSSCSATLLRIGFDPSRHTAVTFLSYGCSEPEQCGGSFAVFLEKRRAEWHVTGYSTRRSRLGKRTLH